MTDYKSCFTPLDPNQKRSFEMTPKDDSERKEMEKISYQSAVGSLLYAARSTRPDIIFAVTLFTRFNNNPGQPLDCSQNSSKIFGSHKGYEDQQSGFHTGQHHPPSAAHRRDQRRLLLCFSREAVSEEEGTTTQPNFQGGIISWEPQIKYLGVIFDSRMNCGAHIHRILHRGRQMSGTLYPLLIGRSKLDPSHVPEPDTKGGPQRSLVCKEHHATRIRSSGATHVLHPKNSQPILQPSTGLLEPSRVGILRLLPQDSLEVPSITATRRGPPGLTAGQMKMQIYSSRSLYLELFAKTMRKAIYIAFGILGAAIVITVVVVLAVLLTRSDSLPPPCDSKIFCYVDLAMVDDEDVILNRFEDFLESHEDGIITSIDIFGFINQNFVNDHGVDKWEPNDFQANPSLLLYIEENEIKQFAIEVIKIWKELGRKVKQAVKDHSSRYSLIYVPNGFIIPGGRFVEYYYWDSYWIIDGLLVSEMNSTAAGMIDNFLDIVKRFGHIPNGGRVYYLRRSQPPLLSFMGKLYYEQTKNVEWLAERVSTFEVEAKYWVDRLEKIEIEGTTYYAGTYNAPSSGPRPESYKEDFVTAITSEYKDDPDKLYIQLKSAAESGWDFSSRWFVDNQNNYTLPYTNITRILPVDLNAFLFGAFNNIAEFYDILNQEDKKTYWTDKAQEIYKTINEILWNKDDGICNLAPLWTRAYDTGTENTLSLIDSVIDYLQRESIMDYEGGIPATTENTGQQWDFPNVWPCLQSIIVEGLEASGTEKGKYWAQVFARRFVESAMEGYRTYESMFEKYDAVTPGYYGGGDNQPSKGELEGFLAKNFVSEQELVPWIPEDYVEDPCFFADIKSEELRRFAGSTIKLWKTLGKKISEAVFDQPDRHSLIPIPNGFIASGGRYKEYYYWDNYWIIDSLIICGMLETAKGMIENFVTLILHYGYVPNGGRIYYSQRSQPPLLPFMVMRYYEETTDITWLEYFISFFETEMQYWVDNRMTTVTIGDKEMDVGVYRAESRGPRPEAYYEDVTYAEYFKTKEEQQRYYSDIKASAESGWDSSSRWIYDDQGGTEANLTFSRISKIVPVDLNAFLYGAFNIMSKFYLDLENYGKQSYWHKKATDMKVVIQELFWNEEDGLFDFPGGVPSSLQNTGKQWDMPNVWPPLQSMIVNGFYNADVSNGKYVARILAEKFLTATKKSFNSNGAMYQRYHAEHVGEPGPKAYRMALRVASSVFA
ncbi:hypothetical protein Trydic_g9151 [Trypoxylus dichotomus]